MDQQQIADNQPKHYQKTQAAFAMMDCGMDAKTALQIVNNTPKPAKATIYSLKAKHKKYSLQAPKMQKLAHNAIQDCLTDQPIKQAITKKDKDGNAIEIIEETVPSWTNKIAAASMVYDRCEPVVKQSVQINMDIDPINLDVYRNRIASSVAKAGLELDSQAIDITSNNDKV
jgi:hypothetical protein